MTAELLPDREPVSSAAGHEYVVVARRYRPQDFGQLVGQDTVSQGLASAIQTNRVGHAYLFTGARGVGKTSTARIFAKSLNCVRGPTLTPCGECDICQGIAAGSDVDVLEIDGASNRGIDEIRQLRQNVNIRPSRARFKIYIIDEVHMLTTQAFNALLKTLEEPPEHVKFIFCTTEADKIPITVLSRCQRFDFAPMEVGSIVGRLEYILKNEQVEYEPEALQIIARRAAGSMRDSQSLLEQLLSFGGKRLTVTDVHAMLGTAQSGRLLEFARLLLARDAAGSLMALDRAIQEGVDPGQLTEQLLGLFRDIAATVVGCGPDLMLHVSGSDQPELMTLGQAWGLETLLAAIQILDHSLLRMRQSTHVRVLVEMALVRLCHLDNLQELSNLVQQLQQAPGASAARPVRPVGSPAAPIAPSPAAARVAPSPSMMPPAADVGKKPPIAEEKSSTVQKKTAELETSVVSRGTEVDSVSQSSSEPPSTGSLPPLSLDEVRRAWAAALAELAEQGDMTGDYARLATEVTPQGSQQIIVLFPATYAYQKSACERPDRRGRLETLVGRNLGRAVKLDVRHGGPAPASAPAAPPPLTQMQKSQRKREKERHPLVRQAIELFDAEIEEIRFPAVKDDADAPAAAVTEDTQ